MSDVFIVEYKISRNQVLIKPAIILNSVVFPQPEGPKRVKNSPLFYFEIYSYIKIIIMFFLYC